MSDYILSSKLSIKFANKSKQLDSKSFVKDYKLTCQKFVDVLWNDCYLNNIPVPSLLPKDFTSNHNSRFGSRMIQCIAKQASGIVRGTVDSYNQKLSYLNYSLKYAEDHNKEISKIQKSIDNLKVSKPDLKNVSPELDSRFVKIDFDNNTSFDGWITISQIDRKTKLVIPIKRTAHFNKLYQSGQIKQGIRLSSKYATFNFKFEKQDKEEGNILGVDIGMNTVVSFSDSQESGEDIHGWSLAKICDKLSHKKKGSKSFQKTCNHRQNHINWCLNQINFDNVKQLNCEDIKLIRNEKRSSRYMSHWTYTEIYDKLERICDKNNVYLNYRDQAYTSQRCSVCGWVKKTNRKGKIFHCNKCKFTDDADHNASINISIPLPSMKGKIHLKNNVIGFYWNLSDQESIVPDA
jgi:transposase